MLSRFEEGYAPILLENVSSGTVSSESLEDALDNLLDPDADFPVEYPTQEDALLLHCRFPKPVKTLLQEAENSAEDSLCPVSSIMGLTEEFEGRQPMLNLMVYKGKIEIDTSSNNSSSGSYQAPHSSWKRQPLEEFPDPRNAALPTDPVDFLWVDVRPCGTDALLFPSLASVAHFFRSLMGSSHFASPWCPHDRTTTHPHRIGVLFAGVPPPSVFGVRVGDICPSWYLYSISRLLLPESWSPCESNPPDTALRRPPATLLIFKPLPPRLFLGLSRPSRVVPDATLLPALPKGCLWEVYFEDPEEEEDAETNGKKPKARKIPHCRMTAPPYLSYLEDYDASMLQALMEHWEVIRDEALQIPQWTAWPETQHYSKARSKPHDDHDNGDFAENDDEEPFHPSWNVFPLCHCFPANQPENQKWIDKTCAFVPQTVQLLRRHLGPVLRTALFSRLDPESTLEAHTGWSDLANHVMRCHLPLVVPKGGVCGTWVDGCVETHEEGRFLCFDDSKTHRAFNYSGEDRIVLILDLARPEHLPLGTAVGGHSDELDQFIAQMND